MVSAALGIELRMATVHSLKEKRAVLRRLLAGLDRLASLSVAEVDRHDSWQRTTVGVAAVASTPGDLDRVLRVVRRYLDEQAEIEVLDVRVSYLDDPEERLPDAGWAESRPGPGTGER